MAPFEDDDAEGGRAEARERMVEGLRARGYIERDTTLAAMRAVPRHEFVPASQREHAYADRPLPIGCDQTISAPHMVAIMTDLLAAEDGDQILEIGTGCGYHAAVTCEVVGDGNVYSVEYVESLATEARARLGGLGYEVTLHVGDGHAGWPAHAPYDGAYLTCAAAEIPPAVVEQVGPGGHIVAPVGTHTQRLIRVEVGEEGIENREDHGGVRFVPMRG